MTRRTKEEIEEMKNETQEEMTTRAKPGRPKGSYRRTDQTRMNLYIDRTLADQFRELAKDQGRTVSAQFEWMVKDALNKK